MANPFISLDHLAAQAFCAAVVALSSISCAATLPMLTAVPGKPASTTGFVNAVQKSNGSRVILQYKVGTAANAGLPITVNLTFSAVTDAAASVRFTSDAGLRLLASDASVRLPLGSSELDIRAVPDANGLFYLNVFTSQNGATSAVSIPVSVGNGKPKLDAMGETKPSADGEKVISMPVR